MIILVKRVFTVSVSFIGGVARIYLVFSIELRSYCVKAVLDNLRVATHGIRKKIISSVRKRKEAFEETEFHLLLMFEYIPMNLEMFPALLRVKNCRKGIPSRVADCLKPDSQEKSTSFPLKREI